MARVGHPWQVSSTYLGRSSGFTRTCRPMRIARILPALIRRPSVRVEIPSISAASFGRSRCGAPCAAAGLGRAPEFECLFWCGLGCSIAVWPFVPIRLGWCHLISIRWGDGGRCCPQFPGRYTGKKSGNQNERLYRSRSPRSSRSPRRACRRARRRIGSRRRTLWWFVLLERNGEPALPEVVFHQADGSFFVHEKGAQN